MAIKEHVEIPHPIYGRVDMSAVQSVLHSPPVQRLMQIKQLGGAYFIFPFATHTRLAHSIGVTHITQLRTDWLLKRGEISVRDARNLAVTALVHDIGHWAFSHMLEPLCGNHDQRGLEIVVGVLAPFLTQMDVYPDDIAALMNREKESTLAELLFTNPIGADKLDYLTIDPWCSIGPESGLDDLFTAHVRWHKQLGLYVLPKGLKMVKRTIERSWYMFTEVYERPSTRVFQRSLQEMIVQMIEIEPIVKKRLYGGGEDGVIGAIGYWAEQNQGHECSERYNRFLLRNHPKKALVFCENVDLVPLRNKPTMAKIECHPNLLRKSEGWGLEQVASAEKQIAELLSLTHPQVTVAIPPPARRWKVPKVKVDNGNGVSLIGDLIPELHQMAASEAKIACSLVIAVDAEARPRLVADKHMHCQIHEILEEI